MAKSGLVDIPNTFRLHFCHVDSDEVEDRNKLQCLFPDCKKILQYNKSHGWFNFERHLINIHQVSAEDFKKGRKAENTKITSYCTPLWKRTPKFKRYGKHDPIQVRFGRDIIDYIAMDGAPLNVGEGTGFQKLIQGLDNKLTIPSRRSIGRNLKVEAEKTRRMYRKNLQKSGDGAVHLTLDFWSSIQNKSVLGVKVQFIDSEWSLRNLTIGFKHFEKANTAENLKSFLENLLLTEYGVKIEQFGVIMADNASEMVKAFTVKAAVPTTQAEPDTESDSESQANSDNEEVDEASIRSPDDELDLDGQENEETVGLTNSLMESTPRFSASFQRLGCTAHALQLVVKECIRKNPTAVRIECTVSRLVQFFRKSNYWSNQLFIKTKLLLIRPGATRWSSLYYAMHRLLKDDYVAALNLVLEDAHKKKGARTSGKPPALVSDSVLELIRGLCTLMQPLCDLTNDLQGNEVTSSQVIPGLLSVYKSLSLQEVDQSEFLTSMRRSLCLALVERFGADVQQDYSGRGPRKQLLEVFKKKEYVFSTLLDPRMKARAFGVKLDEPYGLERYVYNQEEAVKLLNDYIRVSETERNPRQDVVEVPVITGEPAIKKRKSYDIFEMMEQVSQNETYGPLGSAGTGAESVVFPDDELKAYLSEDFQPKDTNPLLYWKKMSQTFPRLAKLAKTYLAIPASTGSVERLFSIAGSIARARRARLTVVQLESLLLHKEKREFELNKRTT